MRRAAAGGTVGAGARRDARRRLTSLSTERRLVPPLTRPPGSIPIVPASSSMAYTPPVWTRAAALSKLGTAAVDSSRSQFGRKSMKYPASLVVALSLLGSLPAAAQTIVSLGSNFDVPEGVAVDSSGNIFVADTQNSLVKEILAVGGYVTVNTLSTGISLPTSAAVDSHGNVFVADFNHNAVKEILAASGYTTAVTLGSGFSSPSGVALDAAGNVYVADQGNNAVKEILAAGGYATVNTLGGGFGFDFPTGVALDGRGDVFVADQGNGAVEEILAGALTQVNVLNSTFNEPAAVAVDSSGNVYVADQAVNTVSQLLASSNFATIVPVGSGFNSPTGLALDASGNVYVGDSGNAQVKKVLAPGFTGITALAGGFVFPEGLAIDAAGDVFVADFGTSSIGEILASSGLTTVKTIASGFFQPTGVAVDADGNVFVADQGDSEVKEILAAGGYVTVDTLGSGFANPSGVAADGNVTVNTLGSGFVLPTGVAVDGSDNVFVVDQGNVAVKEILAAGGFVTVDTLAGGFTGFSVPQGLALDADDNVFVADFGAGSVFKILAAGGFATVDTVAGGFSEPTSVAIDGSGDVIVANSGASEVQKIVGVSPLLVAAVLPGSRSVEIGHPATIFASMINTSPNALADCLVALPDSAPAGLSLTYQTTNPATNALTGTANTPVTIAGNDGLQTFLLAFSSTAAFTAPALAVQFECTGSTPADTVIGVDTVDLTFSSTPIADIIALAATATNNGILEFPEGGAGAFAVASFNVGVTATLTVSVDTGGASLPIATSICETNPSTGQCLATAAASVTLSYAGGAAPTFSIFVAADGPIAFAPASSRVFVRFEDASGAVHGSTSVAIETN